MELLGEFNEVSVSAIEEGKTFSLLLILWGSLKRVVGFFFEILAELGRGLGLRK